MHTEAWISFIWQEVYTVQFDDFFMTTTLFDKIIFFQTNSESTILDMYQISYETNEMTFKDWKFHFLRHYDMKFKVTKIIFD